MLPAVDNPVIVIFTIVVFKVSDQRRPLPDSVKKETDQQQKKTEIEYYYPHALIIDCPCR